MASDDEGPSSPQSLGPPSPRQIRFGRNQTTIRKINESIEEGLRTADGLIGFVCECGALGCGRIVPLRLDEYEQVRSDSRQFLVAAAHETLEDRVVVAIDDRFTIVAKGGEEAKVAHATDPRAEKSAADVIWSAGRSAAAIRLTVEAEPLNVGVVRRWVLAFAAEHGAGRVLQGRIGIAVAEAVTNAVVHAYDPSVSGSVEVAVEVEEDDLEVVVADAGRGFRPEEPSGLGAGLLLIAETSDRFAIRERLPAGIEVWMRFELGAER
jgi:anti-sigma regulatory factor (Ser/Thr protein kinase)